MNKQKRRIFNYRPLAIIFVELLLIISATNYYINKDFFIAVSITIAWITILIICLYKKKYVMLLSNIVISFIFIIYFCLCIFTFTDKTTQTNNINVVGRVETVVSAYGNYKKVYLDDIALSDVNKNYKIEISFLDYSGVFESIEVGNILTFTTSLNRKYILTDELPSSKTYSENIKFEGIVNVALVELRGTKYLVSDKIKAKSKDLLSNGLNVENTELAYSALFGDKADFPQGTKEKFSASGISHLIAVSGLHVGMIVVIISFLLSLLKVKSFVKFLITIILMLMYGFVCNFSPSIIRAIIMTTILLGAPLVYRSYDAASSICFAGIIMLCINPFSMFDIGAMLSFGSVFAIAFFFAPLSSALRRCKLGNKFSSALAVSISAQIGIIGAMVFAFEEVQVLSTFTNIVAVPLFTLAFSATFIILLLSFIIPFISYAFYFVNPIFTVVVFSAKAVSQIPFATVSTISIDYLSYLLYNTFIVFCSKFCIADKDFKLTCASLILTTFVLYNVVLIF